MSRHDDDLEGEALDFPEAGLTRRALLRTAGAASMVLPAMGATAAEAAEPAAGPDARAGERRARPRFFSAVDFALVEELTETVIPTDAHSPGAKAAGVALEIDRRLAEQPSLDPDAAPRKRLWREGLRQVDEAAGKLAGAPFVKLTPEQRVAVLTEFAKNEKDPRTTAERFFVDLKRETARAYYTSQIGIQQELEYKGNSYLQEFVGHDVATVPIRKR